PNFNRSRSRLVVRWRLRGRRVPSSKPDYPDDPSCIWVWYTLNLMAWVVVANLEWGANISGILVM
ncbi:hypothetical protein AVEN_192890-1, partial [Araneus ventricosus]